MGCLHTLSSRPRSPTSRPPILQGPLLPVVRRGAGASRNLARTPPSPRPAADAKQPAQQRAPARSQKRLAKSTRLFLPQQQPCLGPATPHGAGNWKCSSRLHLFAMVPASRMLRAACRQEEDLTSYKPCRRHLRKLKWLLATDFMLTAHIAGVLPPRTGHQLTPCPDVSPRSTAVCGPEGEPEHKQTKVPRHSPTAGVSWGTEKGWNTALIRGKPFCLHKQLPALPA